MLLYRYYHFIIIIETFSDTFTRTWTSIDNFEFFVLIKMLNALFFVCFNDCFGFFCWYFSTKNFKFRLRFFIFQMRWCGIGIVLFWGHVWCFLWVRFAYLCIISGNLFLRNKDSSTFLNFKCIFSTNLLFYIEIILRLNWSIMDFLS
jgi:hypothetical protein